MMDCASRLLTQRRWLFRIFLHPPIKRWHWLMASSNDEDRDSDAWSCFLLILVLFCFFVLSGFVKTYKLALLRFTTKVRNNHRLFVFFCQYLCLSPSRGRQMKSSSWISDSNHNRLCHNYCFVTGVVISFFVADVVIVTNGGRVAEWHLWDRQPRVAKTSPSSWALTWGRGPPVFWRWWSWWWWDWELWWCCQRTIL